MDDPRSRAAMFSDRFGIHVPILLAPMAGACPPSSYRGDRVGGFGACAALLMQPKEIEDWAAEVRANVDRPLWAGQSAALARAEFASVITERVWSQAPDALAKMKNVPNRIGSVRFLYYRSLATTLVRSA
ncbi:MAG: hypothetical protein DME44_08845 [Verrucomicrobia bacterium]|nr:MAG: hypothetical protein DME44_08845 [Verrucomicrobiota bacterium]